VSTTAAQHPDARRPGAARTPEKARTPGKPGSKPGRQPGRKPGRKRSPGWVPNQHGAWAMLAGPLVVGVVASGPAWVHLPLAALWFLGYSPSSPPASG